MNPTLLALGTTLAATAAFAGATATWNTGSDSTITGDGTDAIVEIPAEGVTTTGLQIDSQGGRITLRGGSLKIETASGAIAAENLRLECPLEATGDLEFNLAARYDPFLPAGTPQVIWKNRRLQDLVSMSGTMSGAWLSGKAVDAICVIASRTDTRLVAQFQCLDSGWTKSTLCIFEQDGPDITAYGRNSGYFSGDLLGTVLPDEGHFNMEVSTAPNNGAYGVSAIRAHFGNTPACTLVAAPQIAGKITISNGELALEPAQDFTLGNALSGNGSFALRGTARAHKHTRFLTASPTRILTNAHPSRVHLGDLRIGGGAISSVPLPTTLHHEIYDEATQTRTVQASISEGGYIKTVCVQLVPDGDHLAAKTAWAKYVSASGHGVDEDYASQGSAALIATSYSAGGYGAAELTLVEDGARTVTLSGEKSFTGGLFVERGELVITQSKLPANSTNTVASGGILRHTPASGAWYGGGSLSYILLEGGTLTLPEWLSASAGDSVECRGGVVEPLSYSGQYLNQVALCAPGTICGRSPRVGYASDALWATYGSDPVEILAGAVLVNNGTRCFALRTDVDTLLRGNLNEESSYKGASFAKEGAARLTLFGATSTTGSFVLREGTLALANPKAITTSNPLTLQGGVLEAAASCSAGSLTLGASATIDCTAFALAFAASSAQTWAPGATLRVLGDFGAHSTALRFGTDASGLTSSQLDCIAFADEGVRGKARLDAAGYLRKYTSTIIILR